MPNPATPMIETAADRTTLDILDKFAELRRRGQLLVMQKLRGLNIGPKQALMICKLSQAGELSMAELARATTTDPAALGKAVQSLVARGWVVQRSDKKDARRKVLKLTAKGAALSEKLRIRITEHSERVFGFLSPRERNELWSYISRALDHLSEGPGLRTELGACVLEADEESAG